MASRGRSSQVDVQAERASGTSSYIGRGRGASDLLGGENPDWGYSRLEDELAKLGIDIGETTIRDIFKRHGLPLHRNVPAKEAVMAELHVRSDFPPGIGA